MYKYVSKEGLRTFLENLAAKWVRYDNTNSGLSSTTVQGAVDEVASSISVKSISIDTLGLDEASALETICATMPDKTKLVFEVPTDSDEYPFAHAICTIIKVRSHRCTVELQNCGFSGFNYKASTSWRVDSGLKGWSESLMVSHASITDGDVLNLNNITNAGVYYHSTNNIDLTNSPASSGAHAGMLEVFNFGSSFILQRFTQRTTLKVWYRQKLNDTWSSWAEK